MARSRAAGSRERASSPLHGCVRAAGLGRKVVGSAVASPLELFIFVRVSEHLKCHASLFFVLLCFRGLLRAGLLVFGVISKRFFLVATVSSSSSAHVSAHQCVVGCCVAAISHLLLAGRFRAM